MQHWACHDASCIDRRNYAAAVHRLWHTGTFMWLDRAHAEFPPVRAAGRTSNLFSKQGLQKWWPQGVDSGSLSSSLHSVQVNSRSARSCSEACARRQHCQRPAAGLQVSRVSV